MAVHTITFTTEELDDAISALFSKSVAYLILSCEAETDGVRRGAKILDKRMMDLRDKLKAARDEGPEDDGFVARSSTASPSMPTTHFSMQAAE